MTSPPNSGKQICAVIVTYNIGEKFHLCFDSIIDQVGEVIIIDNGSTRETLEVLGGLEKQGRTTVIYNHENLGIAAALNQGARAAMQKGYEWVLTLDHDSEATAGMTEKLLAAWAKADPQADRKTAIVAANPFDVNAETYPYGYSPSRPAPETVEVTTAMSSGSLISRRAFETVGFFDDRLFLYYVDVDFCARLRRHGFCVLLCPAAVLQHREGFKLRKRLLGRPFFYDKYGKEARYYIARNSLHILRTAWRHHELLRSSWVAKRLVTDFVKVLFYDEARFQKASYMLKGIWDGLRQRYGSL